MCAPGPVTMRGPFYSWRPDPVFIIHLITNAECAAKTGKEYGKNRQGHKDATGIMVEREINVEPAPFFFSLIPE